MLKKLVDNSFRSIDEGLYDLNSDRSHDALDLTNDIRIMMNNKKIPIIAEVKLASPSKGQITENENFDLVDTAEQMVQGGAVAISVLTQKYLFKGSVNNFVTVRKNVSIPMLMKDIIVSETQIECGKKIGADYILLIKTIFDKGLAEGSIEKFAEYSHKKGLNILYEVHTEDEFKEILDFKLGKRDLVGINNRSLETLKIDLKITENLLAKKIKGKNLIISESGIEKKEQIRHLKNLGVDAFLIGTSLMEKNQHIRSKLMELVNSMNEVGS